MSKLLLIGLGVMGNAILTSLRLSEFSQIYLMDGDFVDKKNIGTQLLYSPDDVGRLKANVIAERLNKAKEIFVPVPEYLYLTSQLEEIDPDLIIDATDNISSKEIVNQYSLGKGKKAVITSVSETKGFAIKPSQQYACFDCLLANTTVKNIECTQANMVIAIKLAVSLNHFINDEKHNFLEVSKNGERLLLLNKAKNCRVGGIDIYQVCGKTIKVLPRISLDFNLLRQKGKEIGDIIIVEEGGKRFTVSKNGEIMAENASKEDINKFIAKYRI